MRWSPTRPTPGPRWESPDIKLPSWFLSPTPAARRCCCPPSKHLLPPTRLQKLFCPSCSVCQGPPGGSPGGRRLMRNMSYNHDGKAARSEHPQRAAHIGPPVPGSWEGDSKGGFPAGGPATRSTGAAARAGPPHPPRPRSPRPSIIHRHPEKPGCGLPAPLPRDPPPAAGGLSGPAVRLQHRSLQAGAITFKPSRTGALSVRASDGRVTSGSSGCGSTTSLPGAPSATTSGSTSF